jgi:hypothetical protein
MSLDPVLQSRLDQIQPPPAPPYQGGEFKVPLLFQEGLGVVRYKLESLSDKFNVWSIP